MYEGFKRPAFRSAPARSREFFDGLEFVVHEVVGAVGEVGDGSGVGIDAEIVIEGGEDLLEMDGAVGRRIWLCL